MTPDAAVDPSLCTGEYVDAMIGIPTPAPSDPFVTLDTGQGWKAWLDYRGRVYQQRDGKRARRVRFGALPGFFAVMREQMEAAPLGMGGFG